jgi:hypothetical protein
MNYDSVMSISQVNGQALECDGVLDDLRSISDISNSTTSKQKRSPYSVASRMSTGDWLADLCSSNSNSKTKVSFAGHGDAMSVEGGKSYSAATNANNLLEG